MERSKYEDLVHRYSSLYEGVASLRKEYEYLLQRKEMLERDSHSLTPEEAAELKAIKQRLDSPEMPRVYERFELYSLILEDFREKLHRAGQLEGEAQRMLKEAREERERRIRDIVGHFSQLIESEREKLRAVEKERERALSLIQERRERLLSLHPPIIGAINELTEKEKEFIDEIERRLKEIGEELSSFVDKLPPPGEALALYLPLILFLMEGGERTRWVPLSPSIVNVRVKESFLGGKSLSFDIETLCPSAEEFIPGTLEAVLQSSRSFREEVLGSSHNILRDAARREALHEEIKSLSRLGFKEKALSSLRARLESLFLI